MPHCERNNRPLWQRDHEWEAALVASLRNVNYVLLQRDWRASRHGDLDIATDATAWPQIVSAIESLCQRGAGTVCKAYEIERGVVCVVVATAGGYVQLDTAIAPHRRHMFGAELRKALREKELVEGAFVVTADTAMTYAEAKRAYKASPLRRAWRRVGNIGIIARRLVEATVVARGSVIYIPYVGDQSILRCDCVSRAAMKYLTGSLLRRYGE